MKITKFLFITLLLSSLCALQIQAQQTIVRASIDSTHLLIGQQTNILLEVIQPKGKRIQMPIPQDTITKGVELLSVSKPDTTDLGSTLQISQKYLVTSFDSAIYVLPPFPAIDGTDTIRSNTLGLKVSTIPNIDTESKKFFDIKNVISPPFVLKDYAFIIWIIIGICILILLGWYFYDVWRGKRRLNLFKKPEEPKLPPHIIAINELDNIKAQKLWQQGLNKQYHSSITDTLRKYIEERFGTHAMEMTSGEILEKIKRISDTDSVYDNLKQILQLADFVKFAKYQPLPDENELSMMNAYLFVNQTKKEEIIKEETKLTEVTEITLPVNSDNSRLSSD